MGGVVDIVVSDSGLTISMGCGGGGVALSLVNHLTEGIFFFFKEIVFFYTIVRMDCLYFRA